jgi:hypothetical protein
MKKALNRTVTKILSRKIFKGSLLGYISYLYCFLCRIDGLMLHIDKVESYTR